MPADAADLERLQRWFHAAITHPGGIGEGLRSEQAKNLLPAAHEDLETVVLPSKALNSSQRLAIYANMYIDRLIEVLAEEFPTVRHLLGPEAFESVVTSYVARHPSTYYSLAQLGRAFPGFLREECAASTQANAEFAAAVATVERTMEEVFDEAQHEPLALGELQAIGADGWDRARLKTVAALRLLELPYPVNDYISAVRDGRDMDIPDACRSFTVVYRLDYHVWRKDLDEQQFTLLSALREGRTLADALIACAELPGTDPAALAARVHDWFRDWMAEGFFHRVDLA